MQLITVFFGAQNHINARIFFGRKSSRMIFSMGPERVLQRGHWSLLAERILQWRTLLPKRRVVGSYLLLASRRASHRGHLQVSFGGKNPIMSDTFSGKKSGRILFCCQPRKWHRSEANYRFLLVGKILTSYNVGVFFTGRLFLQKEHIQFQVGL